MGKWEMPDIQEDTDEATISELNPEPIENAAGCQTRTGSKRWLWQELKCSQPKRSNSTSQCFDFQDMGLGKHKLYILGL